MPKIDQIKKKPNLSVVKTTKKLNSKKNKSSPIDYYNCLLTKAQQDWYDPQTGTKKRITACCKECKANAPKLQEQRKQEIKKLIISYQQVGDSLKKLLKPIK
jgi:hypothetical protein